MAGQGRTGQGSEWTGRAATDRQTDAIARRLVVVPPYKNARCLKLEEHDSGMGLLGPQGEEGGGVGCAAACLWPLRSPPGDSDSACNPGSGALGHL